MANLGTVALSEAGFRGGLQRFTLAWTSNGDGNARLENISRIEGTVERIVFNPGGLSGAGPTDNYDVTLKDEDELDILVSSGVNLDTATTTSVEQVGSALADLLIPIATVGLLDFDVQNAGAASTGEVRIFVRR